VRYAGDASVLQYPALVQLGQYGVDPLRALELRVRRNVYGDRTRTAEQRTRRPLPRSRVDRDRQPLSVRYVVQQVDRRHEHGQVEALDQFRVPTGLLLQALVRSSPGVNGDQRSRFACRLGSRMSEPWKSRLTLMPLSSIVSMSADASE